jgi:hypothetical protein
MLIRLCFIAGLVLATSSGVAQEHTDFQGQPSIRYRISPEASVYAIACDYKGKSSIRYDVSYEKWVSAKRALFAVAAGIASNDASATGNMVDEPRRLGKLYVTADAVTFVPDGSNEDQGWTIERSQLIVKHTSIGGEEVKASEKSLHGLLHLQPMSDLTGQLLWSNGLGAQALEDRHPKGTSAEFLDYFHYSLADPSMALEKISTK